MILGTLTGGGLFSAAAGGNYSNSHYSNSTMNRLMKLTYKPVASQAAVLTLSAQYQDMPGLWMHTFHLWS